MGSRNKCVLEITINLVILKFRVQGTLWIQNKQDRKLYFQWYLFSVITVSGSYDITKPGPDPARFLGICLVIWMQEIPLPAIRLSTYDNYIRKCLASFGIAQNKPCNWGLDQEHLHILLLFYHSKINMKQNQRIVRHKKLYGIICSPSVIVWSTSVPYLM